jgi:hypothetical protein
MDMMVLTHEKLEALGVRRKEERDVMLRSLAMMPTAAESSGVSPANNRSLRGKKPGDRIPVSVSQIFSPQSAHTDAVSSPLPAPAESPSTITHNFHKDLLESASSNLQKLAESSPSAILRKSPEGSSRPRREPRNNPKSPTHRTGSPSRRRSTSTPILKAENG